MGSPSATKPQQTCSQYADGQHKTWDDIFPYVTFAYNMVVQKTTCFPPFRLTYGLDVQTALDVMLPCATDDQMLTLHAEDFTQHVEEAHQLARMQIRRQQGTDARRYNQLHRLVEYQPALKSMKPP